MDRWILELATNALLIALPFWPSFSPFDAVGEGWSLYVGAAQFSVNGKLSGP